MNIPIGYKKVATLSVLKNGSKFLLLKRLREPNRNKYTPVGGKLEPFESPLNCAMRETYEETDIKVAEMKLGGILTENSPTKYNWISFVYISEIEHVAPPASNEGSLEWIEFEDVLKVPTPKTDWFIYKYILEEKPFVFNVEYDSELNLLAIQEEIENKTLLQL